MTRVLAVDLGGSSLRAGVVEAGGRIVAAARHPLSQPLGHGGVSEADPELWWQALLGAFRRLGSRLEGIGGLAISGFTRSQVLLDAEGRAVGPAILFGDSRAADLVAEAHATPAIAAHPGVGHLNPFHPLARLAWLRRHAPAVWAATHHVVEPKDYLAARLTGRIVSDPVSQYWLARSFAAPEGHTALASLLGLGTSPCPRHIDPGALVGQITASEIPALAGVPVFCGGPDSWAGVLGSGGMRAGRGYVVSGTTEVTGLMTTARADADGLLTLPWTAELWQVGGPGQNGAAALNWAAGALAPTSREAALAAAAPADAPMFLPFLKGERAPFWDADLRAAYLGLRTHHGAADMLRAAAEGIIFMSRLVLERAEAAAGHRADPLHLSGGGGRSRAFATMRADALARPVRVPREIETGLLGTAALARAGLGLAETPQDAAETLLGETAVFLPDADRAARAEARFQIFRAAHEAMAPISHRLSALAHDTT